MTRPNLSVVLPLAPAQGNMGQAIRRLRRTLSGTGLTCEIILSHDGKPSFAALPLAAIRVITAERRQGQYAALRRGLDAAHGTWLCCLDADLKVPASALQTALNLARQGHDLVVAVPTSRAGLSLGRRLGSLAAHALLGRLQHSTLRYHGPALKLFHRSLWEQVRKDRLLGPYAVLWVEKYSRKPAELPLTFSKGDAASTYTRPALARLLGNILARSLARWAADLALPSPPPKRFLRNNS